MAHISATDMSTPVFELVDSAADRPDQAGRRETKYVVSGTDAQTLRRLLESNCRRVIHNHPVSMVRSIYFDDSRLSAARANLDGFSQRSKLRLRWYDNLNPGREFFFEVKWRNNSVTGKHRFKVRCDTPLEQIPFAAIRNRLESILPEPLTRYVLKYPDPIMIVQYRREHFHSDDGLRITLDDDLTFYDQTGRRIMSTRFPRRLEGMVVLEGKTPPGRERELKRWLYPFAARVGRCSKYLCGCQELGLLHDCDYSVR